MSKHHKTKQRGFTLIELLISITIFSMVVLVAIGALLNLSHVNDRAQALLIALENVDFALENMSRPMRTGKSYDCTGSSSPSPRNCSIDGSSKISFIEGSTVYVYSLDAANGVIMRQRGPLSGPLSSPIQLTAPEILIDELTFNVAGTSEDNKQPRVLITLHGKTRISGLKDNEQAEFNIQTTVSQREVDKSI